MAAFGRFTASVWFWQKEHPVVDSDGGTSHFYTFEEAMWAAHDKALELLQLKEGEGEDMLPVHIKYQTGFLDHAQFQTF